MVLPIEIIQTIFLELCTPQTAFPLHPGELRLLVTSVCSNGQPDSTARPHHTWISRASQSTLSIESSVQASTLRLPSWCRLSIPYHTSLLVPQLHLNIQHSTGSLRSLLTRCALFGVSMSSLRMMTIHPTQPSSPPLSVMLRTPHVLIRVRVPRLLEIASFNCLGNN
ncbi:hypothetical protein BD779DRAFT_1034399 [Infundibulicybe gibba]|nr:hypothetical protein BD779DRAFT_1034399 [Infundibulicybe gibba]